MIRIALVDDHTLFRKGMRAMLSLYSEFEIVMDCRGGRQLLAELETQPVDVVLLDLEMPGMDGIEVTRALQTQFPEVKVIILSMHNDEQYIVHLMENGARGYLLKHAEPDEIQLAINSVAETGYFFSDLVSKVMLSGLIKKHEVMPQFHNDVHLTDREQDVLKLICEEKTNNEIGDELCISPRTVEGHRNNILAKTGARNTAGMVVYAIKNNLFRYN